MWAWLISSALAGDPIHLGPHGQVLLACHAATGMTTELPSRGLVMPVAVARAPTERACRSVNIDLLPLRSIGEVMRLVPGVRHDLTYMGTNAQIRMDGMVIRNPADAGIWPFRPVFR